MPRTKSLWKIIQGLFYLVLCKEIRFPLCGSAKQSIYLVQHDQGRCCVFDFKNDDWQSMASVIGSSVARRQTNGCWRRSEPLTALCGSTLWRRYVRCFSSHAARRPGRVQAFAFAFAPCKGRRLLEQRSCGDKL